MVVLSDSPASAQPAEAGSEDESSTATALNEAKVALERAHFDAAERLLTELLARDSLLARERNDALELFAIVQIAERKDAKARETLLDLLRRDPQHPRRVLDQGPAVDAAFARIKQGHKAAPNVPLRFTLSSDSSRRLVLQLELGEGRDAVESVHVFVLGEASEPSSHLVSTLNGERPLRLLVPGPPRGRHELALYLEARAPSGAVLGRAGEASRSLRIPLPRIDPEFVACTVAPKPLRRQWWLWTAVGLVVSGIVVASAATAQ